MRLKSPLNSLAVIQDDAFNSSRIQTVIVSSITTNLALADAPGNLYLEKQESGLAKDGVVNIYRISTLDKRRLTDKVTTLSQGAMEEIEYG